MSSEHDSETSITRSAISAGQITITDEAALLAQTGQTTATTLATIDGDVLARLTRCQRLPWTASRVIAAGQH